MRQLFYFNFFSFNFSCLHIWALVLCEVPVTVFTVINVTCWVRNGKCSLCELMVSEGFEMEEITKESKEWHDDETFLKLVRNSKT